MAAAKPRASGERNRWVPDRQDIIWIDCNPQIGHEMRDVHPFLVLSPQIFNEKTSLVIGLPMTTAEYNADNPFAVAVGRAPGRKTGQTSYLLCHQPKSFDWRLRKAKPHPLGSSLRELYLWIYNFTVYIPREEDVMRVAKWGNSLAVRLPAAVVEALAIKEGDDIEIHVVGARSFEVRKRPAARELLARLRKFRGRLPPDFKFDRLEANERA